MKQCTNQECERVVGGYTYEHYCCVCGYKLKEVLNEKQEEILRIMRGF